MQSKPENRGITWFMSNPIQAANSWVAPGARRRLTGMTTSQVQELGCPGRAETTVSRRPSAPLFGLNSPEAGAGSMSRGL
jgi:hypothetical protein